MVDGSIARRYARALLEIGREDSAIDTLGGDLERFGALVGGSVLGNVLASPAFTLSERRAVLDTLLGKLELQKQTANFLRLLLDKDRFAALPDIVREYRALADAEAGRVRATVTTAAALTATTQKAVAKALGNATGKQVVLETKVDPGLLGGLVAQVGGRIYDASLRTRLEHLQLSLVNPSQT